MNDYKNIIQHSGRIKQVDDSKIHVTILAQSACSTCHSKAMCNVSEMEEKVVEIIKDKDANYIVGEQVTIYMKKSLGTKAVFYGYLYPFITVLASLVILIAITRNEGLAGLISLALLVPYYYIIYLLKDKLSKTFEFSLKD